MNYLRGALSAASQYYKDLPPINPSTLTGAIDVIVIERPRQDEPSETELVCTPFHVRFGKWQVLRPGEKKARQSKQHITYYQANAISTTDAQVTVLVNGKPIPYGMKIGDAGEAFFVFETDQDIPEDLLTSPILEATKVWPHPLYRGRLFLVNLIQQLEDEIEPKTGRFGAKEPDDNVSQPLASGSNHHDPKVGMRTAHASTTANLSLGVLQLSSEPSFLDLASEDAHRSPVSSRSPSPTSDSSRPIPISRSGSLTPPTSLSANSRESVTTPPPSPPAAGPATPSSFLKGTGKLAKATLVHAPNAAVTRVASIGGALKRAAGVGTDVPDNADIATDPPEVTPEQAAGDRVLPPQEEKATEAPNIVYGHGLSCFRFKGRVSIHHIILCRCRVGYVWLSCQWRDG